ncbi:methylmalonyl-CoA mutase family protein [Nakamurella aerolata]|uniref:Methylmalonyl-CoA mutase n=1 Tax=Nakamurella aerolata TaxID=1656892 RepID=A0A849AGP5_9ACTN|nr:methylmalonyl-CoA mutase family protein [Nakamurella aerolata]NNG36012.1 methylmalonyl-CoA mutase [Nakamurella aerolata]
MPELETPGVATGTRAEWVAAAAAVLRKSGALPADAPDEAAAPDGAGLDQAVLARLGRRTFGGTPVTPLAGVTSTAAGYRRLDGRGWLNCVPLADPDPAQAAAALIADLEGGAQSCWLTVGAAGTALPDLPAVLAPVLLDIAPIELNAVEPVTALQAGRAFARILSDRGVRAPGGGLGADPFGRAIRAGSPEVDTTELAEIASLATDLGLRGFVADATVAHEQGADDGWELGYLLAAVAEYLRLLEAAGITPDVAAALLTLRLPATAEQFTTIARFRAARGLWTRLLELALEPATTVPAPWLHAVTSRMMTTRYDPWVNMLRVTIAALAAGTGGAQAVTVLPFDAALGIPDAFGRRIARNVSHLLLDESHVADTADPAAGAGGIEALTERLAATGWAAFTEIEAAGGLSTAVAGGLLAERFAAQKALRASRIATRAQPLTGVTEFAHAGEQLPQRRPKGKAWPERWASPFEALRDEPAPRPVALVVLGAVASHSVRASFVRNALGAIGSPLAGGDAATADVAAAVAGFDPAAGDIAVVAGSDAAYAGADPTFAGTAADVVTGLRERGARLVLIAGRPPAGVEVDGTVGLGGDLLQLAGLLRGTGVTEVQR